MIRRLPEEVVRKIAAGEVVTGAFSVVKELVENSLDAGAKKVEVEIKGGGKSFIRVCDNGHGMDEEEALLAIQPHTTSKIEKVEDLYRVSTYGFRGEALSSIVKVSRVEILTKKKAGVGVKLEVEGGKIKKVESDETIPEGTCVTVRDLFFNIPARRKFLKSASIEARMVIELMQKFILSRTDVHFILIRDGSVVYNAPPSDLRARAALVMTDVKVRDFLEVDFEKDFVKISGLVSPPGVWRKTRTGQFFFVNGRYVLSGELFGAFEVAYGEALEKGYHPLCVLKIELPPDKVDVNIHPQKLEVKFSHPEIVRSSLISAVGKAIKERIERKLPERGQTGVYPRPTERVETVRESIVELEKSYATKISPKEIEGLPRYLMILRDRYILAEDDEGILLIDYHASHERILYEKIKREYEEKELDSTFLLLPVFVNLDEVQKRVLNENTQVLRKLGFRCEMVEEGVKIIAIPSVLPIQHVPAVISEVIEELRTSTFKGLPDVIQKILADIACKSAVRTGDRITEEDAIEIIRQIYEEKLISCPHGRPLVFRLSYTELDKYFGRS